MNSQLRLGLVGAGEVARKYHLPAIRAVPEVQPCLVADVDCDRAQTLAAWTPFLSFTDDVEDLIGNVDLAIIALPNAFHQPVACRLLEAGIHVLCEKPLARTVAECQCMLASAEKGRALLATGHNRRLRGNIKDAQDLLTRGLIGQVVSIRAEEGSISDWNRSQAYFDPIQSGGGALLDVGIHCIDLIRYLLGEFVQVSYSGNQTRAAVESEAEVTFELESGARGRLVSSRVRNLHNEIEIGGTAGTLTIKLWGRELLLHRPTGKAFRHFPALTLTPVAREMDGSFVDQLTRFVAAIRGGGRPAVDGLDGMKAVEIVEWAYRGTRPIGCLLESVA
jgi:predicted dehydrogenase